MKEERMKILQMIEDDIIDAEEAAILLRSQSNYSDTIEEPEIDIGISFRKMYKEIESELKPVSKDFFEGIISILDNVSHSLNKAAKSMESSERDADRDPRKN